MRTLTASALCVLALQMGCSEDLTWRAVNHMIESDFPTVASITTDSLATRLSDSTARPILLDARSPEEYAVSHLPGAHRVDPEATSFPTLDTLSRDRPVVVYCSVGYRSARIASRLQEQGFNDAVNLKGSIFRWANEGRTVVRDGTPVQAVHPYDDTWGTLLADSLHAYAPPDSARPSQ
jgi:rhodanese-related sulfurtransferase